MTPWEWIAVILTGGLLIPGGVFLIARSFVYMQSSPQAGREYLEWFRAQKAAEHDEAVCAELAKQPTPPAQRRPKAKELVR